MSDGLGGRGVLFASNKRTESVYILLTAPSGYGLYGLFKKFFFKMQFIPSTQQRAVKSQILIHHVTSAVIIYF